MTTPQTNNNEELIDEITPDQLETQDRYIASAKLARAVFAIADKESAYSHPYLSSKCIQNYGLRVVTTQDENTKQTKCFPKTLLVPCHNIDGEIINVERIYYDKTENKYAKRHLSGAKQNGAFYLLGEVSFESKIILLAERYSTAATVYEATDYPTVITFYCGNIIHVAKLMKKSILTASLLFLLTMTDGMKSRIRF